MMTQRKGFTLVELLVVIAIIALLLSIVMPSLRSARELARRITCGTNMSSLALSTLLYANDEDDRLPPLANSLTRNQYRYQNLDTRYWYISTTGSHIVSEKNGEFWNLGVLWQRGLIDNGMVFYCTANNVGEDFRYERYADPTFPTATLPVGGSGAISVRMSYSYNPESLGNSRLEERAMRYTRKSQLPGTAVLLADNIHSSGPPHAGGWNVAYGDGHVTYFRDDELSELIRTTPNFNGTGPVAWAAWDEIVRQMKGR